MYILVIILLICAIQFIYTKKWKFRSLQKIPSPKGVPILGHMGQMKGNIDEMFSNIVSINKHYGEMVVLWKTPVTPNLITTNPEVAQTLLTQHLAKTQLYEYMLPFIGAGLVTSTVDVWKKDRRCLNTAFNLKQMKSYNEILEYHGNELIDILGKEVGKKSVDLVPFIDLYALDISCEAAVNVRTHLQRKPNMQYLEARSTFLTIVMNKAYSFYKGFDFFFKFTNEYKVQENCAKVLKDFSRQLIEDRTNSKEKNPSDTDDSIKTVTDVLSEGNYPLDHAIDHVTTFVAAGQDGPATGMSFALYIIANEPEVQKRLLEESISILGCDKNSAITVQDLQKMVYLEAVIKEALRLYPPLSLLERKTNTEIHVDGITIPAGVDVTINIFGLQRREDCYEDAERFNPDRFLLDNATKIKNVAFLPFSKGPRDCIGKAFAMNELKSVISKVIRNFELLPADPPQKLALTSEFVLKSTTGTQVLLKHRNLQS